MQVRLQAKGEGCSATDYRDHSQISLQAKDQSHSWASNRKTYKVYLLKMEAQIWTVSLKYIVQILKILLIIVVHIKI